MPFLYVARLECQGEIKGHGFMGCAWGSFGSPVNFFFRIKTNRQPPSVGSQSIDTAIAGGSFLPFSPQDALAAGPPP